MGFLSPITALIAAGITIPLLVSLYFLKLRRRQVMISSTLLWKRAVQDLQVNSPFQRLRKSLLLLLQLLILCALLFAMSRPTMQTTAAPGQRVVIVIDHSASMNATDVSPTRLDEAKKAALELIDNLDAGGSGETADQNQAAGGAMVVSFAQNAKVHQSLTSDPVLLRDAIRQINPTDQVSRLGPALRLIEPFAMQTSDAEADKLVVYVISDGRVQVGNEAMSLAGADLRYIPIGGGLDGPRGMAGAAETDNVGIVAFSARRDFEKPEIVQVFARVANFGSERVRTNLTLSLNGRVTQVQPVSLEPAEPITEEPVTQSKANGNETSVQFDFVLPGSALVELSHDHDDQLVADNTVRLTLAPARRLRVLLVTTGNAFLEHGIQSAGVRQLAYMTPEKYEKQDPDALRRGGWSASGTSGLAGEGFDVIVFDGYSPKAVPTVDSLYFASAPPIDGLELIPSREDEPVSQRVLDWERGHPMLRYVVLDDVILSEPGRLVVPPEATVLMTGQSGPLMAEVVRDGVRHVTASFDILRSNWPLFVSFPVFLGNTVQTLGLGDLADDAGVSYRTGEVASIIADIGGELTYEGPVTLKVQRTQGAAVLGPFTRAGVYTTDAKIEPPFDRLSVNLLDPAESDLATAGVLNVSAVASDATAQTATIRREVWRWFIWGALAVMLIEWVVYTRRMHL